jgi:salicylate hydroxylase
MAISNAIVVGGGIGGLAAATAFARRGVAVTLIEQAPRLREVGAGLQVSPNGLCVLRALGMKSNLVQKAAVKGRAVVLRDYKAGKQVARLDLGRLPEDQEYYFLHRSDLIDVLAGAAKRQNVTFEMGAQVASIRPGQTPQVQMVDGSTRRAELVVAADGIHSVTRPVLNGPDEAAFTGQVAWRALVPNSGNHPDEAHVTMGPGKHVVSYPVRGGQFVNLVAVEERQEWASEGWSHSDDPENLRAAFSNFGGDVGDLLAEVKEATLWGLHRHPVATHWARDGVAMIGDAAHPTLPFLAQGANMALEDAWVLADAVMQFGPAGAAAYQTRRHARVSRVIEAANNNAGRYHLRPGPVRTAAHFGLRVASAVAPGRMLGAYDWLYGYDVTA